MKDTSPYIVKVDAHITLRIRTKRDALQIFTLVKQNKDHLSKFLSWVSKTKTVSDSENFIARKLKDFKSGDSCDFGVFYDNKMIGSAGYNKINNIDKIGDIGYWVSKEYEGRGIMSKVIAKVIEIGKKKYKLHRIQIRMDVKNKKSQAIPKRLGFIYESTMKDATLRDGKFHDMEMWVLIV